MKKIIKRKTKTTRSSSTRTALSAMSTLRALLSRNLRHIFKKPVLILPSREAHSSLFRYASRILLLLIIIVSTVIVIKKVSALDETTHIIGAGGNTEFAQGTGSSVVVSASAVTLDKRENWLSLDWNYNRQLTVYNRSDIPVSAGSTVQVTVDTASLESVRDDCYDVRIVYRAGDGTLSDIPRSLYLKEGSTTCNDSSTTTISFQAATAIEPGASDNSYYLYYGNITAGNPAYGDNGYDILRADDSVASASLVCPFNGTTTCLDGEVPSTQSGPLRYSGGRGALDFGSANDKVTILDSASNMDITTGSVEMWVKINSYSGSYPRIFSKGSYELVMYTFVNGEGKLEWNTRYSAASSCQVTSGTFKLALNQWYHVALTFDGTTSTIFVNGEVKGQRSDCSGVIYDVSTNFTLGDQASGGRNADVALDEFAVYTRVLDPAEVLSHASSNAPLPIDNSMRLLYHFDENGDDPRDGDASNMIVHDASGLGHHGTVTGAKYIGGLIGIDSSTSDTGITGTQSYASHQGIFIEEGTTNLVTNPSFEHATFDTNWGRFYSNYDSANDTFTPLMAKRNSAGPFAAGVISQDDYGDLAELGNDSLVYTHSTTINGDFAENADDDQGTLLFWWTPEYSSTQMNTGSAYFYQTRSSSYLSYDWVNDRFVIGIGGPTYNYSVNAGETYLIAFRWDKDLTLNGTHYSSLTVNTDHYFVGTSPLGTAWEDDWGNTTLLGGADGVVEGLTVYRRPLFDGTNGIDVGNGDELEQIWNTGAGKDPTLITGSWDVVFALPTNALPGSITTGTGNAWSHPHASNQIGPTAAGAGQGRYGFMMNGNHLQDGFTWTHEPDSLSGLSLWLKADSITGVADGGTINSWNDSSGNDNHAVQASVGLRATYRANVINGNPVVRFDGLDDYFSLTNRITDAQTIFIVHKWVLDEGEYRPILGDDTVSHFHGSGSGCGTPTTRLFGCSPLVVTGGGWINGSAEAPLPMNKQTDFAILTLRPDSPVTIGTVSRDRFNPRLFYGDIAEVIAFNRGLSDTERQRVERYLSQKYQISYNGGDPILTAMASDQKIFAGGYSWSTEESGDGIKRTLTGLSAGQNYVVRALAHSDGGSVPQVQIWDATNGHEITHLDGTAASTRTNPNALLFTFELPTVARYNPVDDDLSYDWVDSDCTAIEVRLINTQASGTVYWHQIELLVNKLDNPSFEAGSGDPWIPIGWNSGDLDPSDTQQENGTIHTGNQSMQFNSGVSQNEWFYPTLALTANKFNAFGGWSRGDGNAGFFWWGTNNSNYYWQALSGNPDTSHDAVWSHTPGVFRTTGSPGSNRPAIGVDDITGEAFLDDLYSFELTDVSLTITPASEANSLESTGLRVDGRDSLSQVITGLQADVGSIKFKYTPRHSADITTNFGESRPHIFMVANGSFDSQNHNGSSNAATLSDSTRAWVNNQWVGYTVHNRTDGSTGTVTANNATTVTAVLAGGAENDWDSNDLYEILPTAYIRLFWNANNSITLGFNDGGGEHQDTWDATDAIVAGTTYDLEVSYTGLAMNFKINGTTQKSMATSINFTSLPTIAYFGSTSGGAQQCDCTISNFVSAELSVNTTGPYYKFGGKSLKLTHMGTVADEYSTLIDPDSTDTHTLSVYVYDTTEGNIAGTVDATVATLVFGGELVIPASYTDMGGGWWRLTYSAATVDAAQLYGIQVQAGKSIYVDGVQLEAKAYATTYADGSLDGDAVNYAWTGTANESRSTRDTSEIVHPATNNANISEGTLSFWVRPVGWDWSENLTYYRAIFRWGIQWAWQPGIGISAHNNTLYLYSMCDGCGWNVTSRPISGQGWAHVVVSWSVPESTISMTVNNNRVEDNFGTTSITDDFLRFGKATLNANSFRNHGNSIYSDIKIYNKSLTQDEIASLYYQGLATHQQSETSNDKYAETGSWTSPTIDLGAAGLWGETPNLNVTETLNGNTITYETRTSEDGETWSDYMVATGTTPNLDIQSDPNRYLQIKTTLDSTATSQTTTPTFSGLSFNYVEDIIAPDLNASDIHMYTALDGVPVSEESWTPATSPYFTWEDGHDAPNGSGLRGYCAYLGTSPLGDPKTAKGILGTTPVSTANTTCQFIIAENFINLSQELLKGNPWLTSSTLPYYFRLKAVDNTGNVHEGASAEFMFYFDDTPPSNPRGLSAPQEYQRELEAITIYWSNTGDTAATDEHSQVKGFQYRIEDGTWYGSGHTGSEDCTDLFIPEIGQTSLSYTLDADYDELGVGENVFYLRTWDNACNASPTYATAIIKYSADAPSAPQNLRVSPEQSETNEFAFFWDPPESFSGQESALRYCYTVNATPSINRCLWIADTSLAADAYANQPGENIFYLVAKDEAGNVNYLDYASVKFTADTAAPGIPTGIDISDISIKATQSWKLAVTWDDPEDTGAGVASYAVYRTIDDVNCVTDPSAYDLVGGTAGTSFVDASLEQQTYYYCVKACDSTNNCSAFSERVSDIPTGRFREPAELVSGPEVTNISTRSAKISWVTARDSDSNVEFGLAEGEYFEEEVANSDQVVIHTVTLNNLSPATTYFFRAKWTDVDGNTGVSNEHSFTTAPPPALKNVAATYVGITSATVEFTTIGSAQATIYYGPSGSFTTLREVNTSPEESSYTAILPGLNEGTTYTYRINLFDAENQEYEGEIHTFTTLPRPRVINVTIQEVRNTAQPSIDVTWQSNTSVSSIISFYPVSRPDEAREQVDLEPVSGEHTMRITGLLPETAYALVVRGIDALGNEAVSDEHTFTTSTDTRPPKIFNITTKGGVVSPEVQSNRDQSAQLIISWETDEAATSQVLFGEGSTATYTQKSQKIDDLTYNHIVVITNLRPSSVYHLKIESVDTAGNTSESAKIVAITPKTTNSVLNVIFGSLVDIFGFLQ